MGERQEKEEGGGGRREERELTFWEEILEEKSVESWEGRLLGEISGSSKN